MVDPREEQRLWLRAVLARTGLSPHALAGKARISAPTLTVFLNNEKATHALSSRTIAKIEAASGMRYGPEPRPTGFRESEATPYKPGAGPKELDFIKHAVGHANGIDPWILRSRSRSARVVKFLIYNLQ